MHSEASDPAKGFTLIELLVVIAIMALLLSILLPSLSQARKMTRTVLCLTNQRMIGVAMNMYSTDSRSAIVGNAWTSGSLLKQHHSPTYNDFYYPNVCQTWDWASPLDTYAGAGEFDKGPSLTSRQNRFVSLTSFQGFMCPDNTITAMGYSGSPITVSTTMLSYNTALMFQYVYGSGDCEKWQNYIDTGKFTPNIDLVGLPSSKIFLADGARWTNTDTSSPDYNLGVGPSEDNSPGGAFADYGPWSQYSRSYLQNVPITYAMRHGGDDTPGQPLATYKFNAVFFDGHAQTLDGKTGANPNLWLPAGTTLPVTEVTDEARGLYFGSASSITIN